MEGGRGREGPAGAGPSSSVRRAQPFRRIRPELVEDEEEERGAEAELWLREGDETDRLEERGAEPEFWLRGADENVPLEERGAREIVGDATRGEDERGAENLDIEDREDEPLE